MSPCAIIQLGGLPSTGTLDEACLASLKARTQQLLLALRLLALYHAVSTCLQITYPPAQSASAPSVLWSACWYGLDY